MRDLIAGGRRPRAIVCGNDEMALGALTALRAAKLRVPADVAVTGFDDIAAARRARPALSTVRQPMRELGERSVRLLLSRIAAGDAPRAVSGAADRAGRQAQLRLRKPERQRAEAGMSARPDRVATAVGQGGPQIGRSAPGSASTADEAVRADWERRIYRRLSDPAGADGTLALPAPVGLRAEPRAGHALLTWEEVPGAAGYVIERAEAGCAPEIVRHGGSDVPAVAGPPFADTGLADGPEYAYRVGAVTGAEYPVWSWSEPVSTRTAPGPAGPVTVDVDASSDRGKLDRVWRMAGSERLSQLRLGGDPAADRIAAEFAEALRMAHKDLGTQVVRAHAILHDDNGVVAAGPGGALSFDFARVDAIYDQLLAMGLRPVVELSFMPAALARDPGQTVFTYRGIISPPLIWAQWRQLVGELAAHLVDRYGIDEVAQWAFEVWNEPNLEVFWPGTQEEYLRLYDEAARASRRSTRDCWSADRPRPRESGSSRWPRTRPRTASRSTSCPRIPTATFPWTCGPRCGGMVSAPSDLVDRMGHRLYSFRARPRQRDGRAVHAERPVQRPGPVDALAYWVISDHFEELGRPQRLFHNGFGLLSVGNLRKPRYWAVHLAENLGDQLLAVSATRRRRGARWCRPGPTRHEDGTIDVLVWNGTINVALMAGDPRLDRQVSLQVSGLGGQLYQARLARVDERHSNIVAQCPAEVQVAGRGAVGQAARRRPNCTRSG